MERKSFTKQIGLLVPTSQKSIKRMFMMLVGFFALSMSVYAHTAQVAWTIAPNGKLRIYLEHTHGNITNSSTYRVDLQVTVNGVVGPNVPTLATGYIINTSIGSLPGNSVPTVLTSSSTANTRNDWGYWDIDLPPGSCSSGCTVSATVSNPNTAVFFPLNNNLPATATTTLNGGGLNCSPFDISFTNVQNADCLGGETGTATAIANNGIGTYTYAWSNGQSTAIASNLHAGGYSVTATDANGCTSEASLSISDPNGLDISVIDLSNVSCYGDNDGSATLSVTGGTMPYTLNGYYKDGSWNATNTGFGPGTSQLTVDNLTEGQYSFFVEDDNGCQISISTTIDEPTVLVSNIFTSTDVSCNGDSDGTATVYATGGSTPYTYLWSDGQTTVTATGLSAGSYTVAVTDNNGCVSNASVAIGEPAPLSLVENSIIDASCNGGSDGAIYLATIGGTGPYNYEWYNLNGNGFFPADNTEDAVNLPRGRYGVIVTDANGCTFNLSPLRVRQPSAVTVSIGNVSNADCAGNETGSATATASGGTGGYTYAWSNGAATATASDLHAGGYSVTATDANGCTAQASVSISDPNGIELAILENNDVSCNGLSDASVEIGILVGSGTSPFNLAAIYKDGALLSTPNTPFPGSNGSSPLTVSNLAAGQYTFIVEDDNGCLVVISTNVDEPTLLIAEIISTTDALCNGSSDGTATVNATGGTTGYTYLWPNGQTTATATGLAAGSYTVTVTDANDCEATATATIGEPAPLTLALAIINDVSCNGGSDGDIYVNTFGGTGPYNYYWLGATAADNTQDAVDVPAGIYSLTVVDANGCFFTLPNLVVNQPPVLTVTIGNVTNADCAGNETGSATATAAGGTGSYTYAWSNGDATATASALHAGGYSVTATDANGCTAQASVSITDPNGLSMEVVDSSQPWCYGDENGSVTLGILQTGNLGGTPPYRLTSVYFNNYETSVDIPFGGNLLTLDDLGAGQYSFVVKDDNNCEVAVDFTMDEPTLLIADVTTTTDVSCNGGSDGTATVYATGGTTPYGYEWSNGQTTVTATGLPAGTHSVTVTDANGCQESEEVVIGEPDELTLSVNFTIDVSCHGGSDGYIYIQTSGGTAPYNYNWTGTVPQPIDNAEDAQNIAAGTYSVEVTDANGCTFEIEDIEITEPTELTVTIGNVVNADCAGNETGSATATASGGTGDYTYAWSNGDNTATATALHAGGYSVTATDENGCTAQASVSITDPTGMSMEVLLSNQPNCNGGDDGSVTLGIFQSGNLGGTPPYTLVKIVKDLVETTVSIPFTGQSLLIEDLTAGQYSFIVTDANGCEVVEEHTLDEPTLLIAEIISSTGETCLNAADGTATVNATGGTTPYTYLWSDGQTTYAATGFVAGTYTVTVTDANGCEAITSVVIGDPDTTDPIIETFVDLTLNCSNISSTTDPTALITQWLENNYVASDDRELVGVSFDYTPITLDICTASTTVVTWTAIDACGNTATATSNLIIDPDVTDPILTLPAAPLALDCQAISSTSSPAALIADWLAQASATDDCDNAPTLTHDFDMGMLDVCAAADYSITVTWTATDACGNDVSDSQTIDVTVDATAPTLTVPAAPLALDCQAISSTSSPAALIDAWLAEAGATDGCDNAPTLTHDFDMGMLDVCAAADYSITVTWTATDACGNATSDSQTIDVTVDATAPTLTVPAAPLALDCQAISSTSSPAALIDAWLAEAGATDGCDNAPVLTHDFDMGMLDVCAAADYSITVTWTATDACGNATSASQTIDVTVDATAPTLTVPAAPLALDCQAISSTSSPAALIDAWLAEAGATDGCDNAPVLTHDFDMGMLDVCAAADYSITVTWTATDACGNATSDSQTIDVTVDATAPTLTVPAAPLALDCAAISSTSSPAALIDAWLAQASATDGCDNAPVLTHSFDMGMLDICAPADYSITVTWTATDACGNATSASQTIDVTVDVTAPVVIAPADITVDCEDISNTSSPAGIIANFLAGATATDDCSSQVTLTYDLDNTALNVCSPTTSNFCATPVTHFGGNPANSTALLTVENVGGNIEVTATSGTSSPIDFLFIEGPGFTPVSSTTVVDGEITVTIPFAGTPPADFEFQALWSLEDFGGNWQLAVPSTFASTPFSGSCSAVNSNFCGQSVTHFGGNPANSEAILTVENVGGDIEITATSGTSSPIDFLLIEGPGFTPVVSTTVVNGEITVTIPFGGNPPADFEFQALWSLEDFGGNWQLAVPGTFASTPFNGTCIGGGDNIITVTWTATDDCGNAGTATSTITVEPDTEAPMITAPADVTLDADVNCNALLPDYTSNPATDNCDSDVQVTQSPLPGTVLSLGTTVVTLTATDNCGNFTDVTFEVTVEDNTNPVALCQDFTVQLDATGNATITAADVDNGSYDNCSVASVVIDITSFTCADLGSDNEVTLTVTDGAGNTATCISNVTVEDNIAPTFTCPSPVDVQGCDGLVPDLISTIGDEMDNCGVVTLTQNPLPGVSIGGFGNSVDVVITATDGSGNATSCTVTVTVVDDTNPVFQNCPAAIAVANDPDQCGAIVSWLAPVALDNCTVMDENSVVQTVGLPSGSTFPVGSTTITYIATDIDGNTAECTFDVVVSDTEAPEFITTLPADETVECDAIPDPFVVIPMMHTADNCTESMNIVVDYGEEIIDIVCANTYTIVRTWTITDEAGNSAVHKQKVYVQDTTAPTFTVPADVTIECDEDTSPANTGDVTDAMDNCSAPADIVVAFTDVEDLTGCGGYTGTITRTWTATDECGNVTTKVQVITVEDTTGPDAMCQNITVELDENGEVTISANQINNGSTDNCAAQSALTLALSKSSFTCADIGENVVTLTVTDPCGNIGTCVATVTVEDNIAPVITCPNDIVVHLDPGACEQVLSFDVLATDNCDVTVEQIAGSFGSGDGFPIGGPYVLTYEATDEGGNTAQCSFTVTVFEYVPTSNDMTCNSLVNLSLDENCEAIITADQILEGNNYGCYDDYIITSEDANGNIIPGNILDITHVGTTITVTITDPVTGVNCWGEVYVEDKLVPEFDCPADITIACSENAAPALTGEPVITSCELSHTVTSVDVFTDFGQCADPRAQIERTWTVTDDSGNSATCVQVITIAAIDLADVTFPADLVDADALECSDVANDPSLIESGNAGFPTINGLEITNSGLCMASINVTDEIYDICEGSYEILRTWKVRNMCLPIGPGNPVEHTQIIKVLDTEGPVVVAPADITISTDGTSCETGFVAPAANITDGCSSFSVVTDTPFGSLVSNGGSLSQALGLGTHTITYIATDGCGNVGFDEMTITVEDQIAPIAICDENTTVSLDNSGFASIDAITFDDGSYDNCSNVTFDVRKVFNACDPTNNAFGPSVSFCCEEVGTEVMVELRVTDAAGNVNACMVLVEVQDKIDPTVICAASTDVDCSATYLDDIVVGQPLPQAAIDANGEAIASDNCSGVMLTNNVISNTIDCGSGVVTIVWTATDAGGRTSSCIQTYTVDNSNPFIESDITWPLDYETNTCGTGLEPDDLSSPYDYPVTEAAACSNIAVGHDDQVLDFGAADACLKILRTWYVVDWCQATANQDPTQPGPGVWHHTQIIKVINSNDPNVTVVDFPSVVDNYDADCGTVTATFEITADDDCTSVDDLDVTWEFSTGLSGTGFTASGDFLNGSYSVTFTVDDQCGNSTTEVHNFTVVDAKKPTPICIFGIATTVMPSSGSVTISATDFESGSSFDNCTAYDDLAFSFSQDVNDTEIVITCDDVPTNGLVAVDLYVTDEAGNFDFCSTFISVQDPNFVCPNPAALITGTIENEFQEVIEEVTVTLSDDNGMMTAPVVTGPTGVFQFNETYGDYDVTPEKDINYLNGVTTYDLVLISKHILGIELLDSPYKMIAADANNSQSISALDLVKIRALILHLEDEFANNTSWRFVDQDYVFPNPVNPWQEEFPEYIGLTSTQVPANFTALKVGDVNGSASPNSLLGSDTRTFSGNLALQLEATKVAEGETFTVDFTAKDFIEIAGYQFTLGFDQAAVEFVDVTTTNLEGLGSDNFGLAKLEEGVITTSWNSSKGINVEDNTVLFSMTFLANTTVNTEELFTINSRYTESEAYNGTDLFDVVLEFNGNKTESVFELYQNTPNPFKEETMISFNLPQAGAVTLRIMDVSGRTLKLIKLDDAVKGMNSVSLTRDEFNATGVLYYQLESADNTATMKMIIVD